MLDLLSSQCQSEINTKQEMHRELNKKCNVLDSAKTNVLNQENELKKEVTKTQKKAAAAEKKVPIAEKRLKAAQDNLDRINQAVKDTKKENKTAEKKLEKHNKRSIDLNKLCSEYSNERENIERQLDSVNAMEDLDGSSSSSSSSSSLSVGSKRGHSSSSSSSSSSSTRGSKRAKKEKDGEMEMHPGQWLFEEGQACFYGMDFKKEDEKRGQLMMEASASSGFPMAVAYCHLCSWNGLKRDQKKAFGMFVKIEKEMNGYHWAQKMLGDCYQYGYGVGKDDKKRYDYYTLSSEQGNSLAMNNLGVCYGKGLGTDVNLSKAFMWYEKSANLGYCVSMANVGNCYRYGLGGVTKDLNRAKEWYTKAVPHGYTKAQTELDKLNSQ